MSVSNTKTVPISSPPTRRLLFLLCLRIGLFSFGGGMAAWLFREFVIKRTWLSESEFMARLATAQVLPGANVTNMVVMIGASHFGILGGFIALSGLLLGPFFVVIALYLALDWLQQLSGFNAATAGVAAAAAGLLLAMGWRSARNSAGHWSSIVLTALTFFTIAILGWPLIPVICAMVPFGIAVTLLRSRN